LNDISKITFTTATNNETDVVLTITPSDGGGNGQTSRVVIEVEPSGVTIHTTSLPNATEDTAYSTELSATAANNGVVTWQEKTGKELPTWLSLEGDDYPVATFDGVDDYVTTTNVSNFNITNAFSYAIEFTPETDFASQPEWGGMLIKGDDFVASNKQFAMVTRETGIATFFVWDDAGGNVALGSNATFTAGNTYHVVFTFGDGVMSVYVDGVLDNSVPASITPASHGADLKLGENRINEKLQRSI
jgi:hypothetical protein